MHFAFEPKLLAKFLRSCLLTPSRLKENVNQKLGAVNHIRKLSWSELGQAPVGPGVYAWYYEPQITQYDLDQAIRAITDKMAEADRNAAETVIHRLFNDNVLKYFQQDPYDVTLSGPLKPRHTGTVVHDQRISPGLVQRILEEPGRLAGLSDFLTGSAPYFASPVYIGMSESLRTRLSTHRSLIEKYRNQELRHGVVDDASGNEDAGFARRVVTRRIPPDNLFVMVLETSSVNGLHIDLENLLNRIYYPILGRN